MRWTLKRFFWITLGIKLIIGTLLPFAHDEAYYWVWSHHLDLSYFDHPGMVAWLFALGHPFEQFANAARLPFVILSHFTIGLWLLLLKNDLSEERLKFFFFLCLLSPLIGFSSFVATPDVPLLFFWSLALLLFKRLLDFPSVSHAFALGLALGLGFSSKYNMVLFPPFALIAVFLLRRLSVLQWRTLLLITLGGLLGAMPVLLWNYQNDFISFRFQLNHGLSSPKFQWLWPVEYLAAQMALIFPSIVWFASRQREKKWLWLHAFAWGPLLFFFYSSFKAHGEANWPMVAYPAVFALACSSVSQPRALRWPIALWIVAFVIVLSHAFFPWLPVNQTKLKTYEYIRFDSIKSEFLTDRPVYAGSYQMASTLSYQLRKPIFKLAEVNRKDFYDSLPQSRPSTPTFWVVLEPDHTLPQWATDEGYKIISERAITDWYRIVEASKTR